MPALAHRLPGITFRTEAPHAPEALPRMDVAGFVGFAASGPIDVPVPIEDVARFEEIFGGSVTLAWDHDTGTPAEAQLGPVVRAFFREGGRRCWVVRVTEDVRGPLGPQPGAVANVFAVPGVLRGDASRAVWLMARSEGSWSDGAAVNATLTQRPLLLDGSSGTGSGTIGVVGVAARETVRVEGDDPWHDARARLIGFLAAPAPHWGEYNGRRAARTTALSIAEGAWFRTARPEDLVAASPPGAAWLAAPARIVCLTTRPLRADPPAAGEVALGLVRWGVSADGFVAELEPGAAADVRPGAWLRVELASATPFGSTLLLQVSDVDQPQHPASASPPGAQGPLRVEAQSAWWRLDAASLVATAGGLVRLAAAVELELWYRAGNGSVARLAGLGLASGSPRWLGALPSDAELFSPVGTVPQDGALASPAGVRRPDDAFLAEVTHPRFPLAAPTPERQEPLAFLPLGVSGLLRLEWYQPASRQPGTAVERDGLTQLDAALFLDPDLAGVGIAALPGAAFFVEHQSRNSGASGRRLRKLHALWPIEEVSLLAVPDAVDWGWETGSPPRPPLEAPQLHVVPPPDAAGCHDVSWSAVAGAAEYQLQESRDPLFEVSRLVYSGSATRSGCLRLKSDCPATFYYRLRARGADGLSAWSNTRAVVWPEASFERCSPVTIDAPELAVVPPGASAQVRLTWTVPLRAAGYVVEQAGDPGFGLARVVHRGEADAPDPWHRELTVWRDPDSPAWYRVRAVADDVTSPWSAAALVPAMPVAVGIELSGDRDVLPGAPAAAETTVLTVHLAMLRLCAARSDLFAVLSLPAHYRTEPALAYRNRLVRALRQEAPERTLSFAALVHPWLVTRDDRDGGRSPLRTSPPDGVMCGLLAARSNNVGAWAAPANRVLMGAVALTPRIAESAGQAFFDAQCNLLRQQAQGIVLLSNDTLSPDPEWREITVRRLMILLRRLAVREGMKELFAPNDDAFARLMQRRFESVLGELYRLGAFAGATRDEAFRVVADESLNTRQSIEAGRFIMELRVAPSIPLAFLVVRLLQSGGGLTVTEGA